MQVRQAVLEQNGRVFGVRASDDGPGMLLRLCRTDIICMVCIQVIVCKIDNCMLCIIDKIFQFRWPETNGCNKKTSSSGYALGLGLLCCNYTYLANY